MKACILTSREDLQTLQAEWNELLVASPANSLFLTWEWVSTWLAVVRPGARLLVVAVRDEDGSLAAVAPFYVVRMRLGRLVPYSCLRVLGDRDTAGEYPDMIVRGGCEAQALSVIVTALQMQRRFWDCLWLPQLAGWTGARARFAALAQRGALLTNQRPADFATVRLPASHAEYLEALSGNARSSLRRSVKRLAAAAKSVEFVRCESIGELPELLAALFDLHQQRWQSAGQPGCLAPEAPLRRFCERFAPIALRNGWLRLFGLKADGVLRAVQYGYAYAGTFLQVQEGYDPAAPEGIGNVLREFAFKASIEEGLREYDFLGEFSDHKRRWGATQRLGYDLLLGRASLKNRLLFTRPVWPTGRYLREDALAEPASTSGKSPVESTARPAPLCEPAFSVSGPATTETNR
jgi:CelD/BcsL family acetyltransferase involved in cellulose biosynthesis